MEIQQAQKRKMETEAAILVIIQAFEKEIGVCVRNVHTVNAQTMGGFGHTIVVELSVRL